ncbi:MAG: YraN family protein [Chitinophagales bacterium]|nr:YraN family protein [Chitinophagales bacterium]MDW8427299.1 YraN family protein [Chitinophagales bacterium]
MAEHNRLGIKGEKLAARFLQRKGYQILARNWRHGPLEIDLIVSKGGMLVFVEVKSRRCAKFGWPEQALSIAKQKSLVQAAEEYLRQHSIRSDVRFDVLSIMFRGRRAMIRHFQDAFYPAGED